MKIQTKNSVVLFFTFMFVLLPLSQLLAATPVSYGTKLDSQLVKNNQLLSGNKYYQEFSFDGTIGDTVFISMNSPDFDTLLVLLDGNGNILNQNDNSGEKTGAVISNFVLPETRTYYIWATSSQPRRTGAFSFHLDLQPDITMTGTLATGGSAAGTFLSGDPGFSGGQKIHAYTFHGGIIAYSISAVSSEVDTVLYLLDENGQVLMMDNDSGTSTNSKIVFINTQSRNYTIWIATKGAGETGNYTLSLSADPLPIPAGSLNLGASLASGLGQADFQLSTGQYLKIFTVNVIDWQTINFSMSSTDQMDSLLYLFFNDGYMEADNDDFPRESTDATISPYYAFGNGTKLLWATSPYPGDVGNFELNSQQVTQIAGGSISGIVTSQSGYGVARALVEVDDYFTYTRTDGSFHMTNIAPGTYTATFSGDKIITPVPLQNIVIVENTGTDLGSITVEADCVEEVCNGLDDDCDGQIDEGFTDTDNDTTADCIDSDDDDDAVADTDETACGSDPLNYLSTCEICDGVDNDLNDGIDEGFADTDNDGIADCVDIDNDNDGMSDAFEQEIADADPDDDIADIFDVLPEDDFDGDGFSNLREGFSGSDPVLADDIPDCLADFNTDGDVDGTDLAVLCKEYGMEDCIANGPCESDMYVDDAVDEIDLMFMSEDFSREDCLIWPLFPTSGWYGMEECLVEIGHCLCDMDGDNDVDEDDILILVEEYGRTECLLLLK